MKKILYLILFCFSFTAYGQITAPDTMCVGSSATVSTSNHSAVTYHWDFNDVNAIQPFSPLTTFSAGFTVPAFTCFMKDGANYYDFVTEYTTGNIIRLNYGTSIYSAPVITNLGTFGATGGNTEGIDIVRDSVTGDWYGVVVNYSQMIILSFGSTLSNIPTATVTTYPALQWPHQVTVKRFAGSWHAFVANRNAGITRFDFGSSLTNPPVVTNLPTVGSTFTPCNFTLYEQAGQWYMILTDLISAGVTRYDFGADLLNNTPTGTLLPAPPGLFNLPRAVFILLDCHSNLVAYVINESGEMTELDFSGDITNIPVFTPLGASGSFSLGSGAPCAYDDSLYYQVTNFSSGELLLFRPMDFSVPTTLTYFTPSTTFSPSAPGTYSTTLFYDMARPSGPSVACKQIVAVDAPHISGTLAVCQGSTTSLSASIGGGTWSSSNTSVATIDATGVVTGVGIGTSTISYVTPGGCNAAVVVTVSAATPITGNLSLCVGTTTTLSTSTPGGTWTSGAPGVALVVGTSGLIAGMSAGTATISYSIPGGCVVTAVVTVNPLAPITGDSLLCLGSSSSLSDAIPGGLWSSSNTGVAIISSSGVVTSVGAGTSTISYVLPSGCVATTIVTVITTAPIEGTAVVCVGSTVTLSTALSSGAWSSSNNSIATVGTSGIVTGISPGTAAISFTSGSCSSVVIATVMPLPDVITGVLSVCPGSTSTLTDAMGGGTWSSSAPGIASIGSATGIFTGVSPGTATITYSLSTDCFVTAVVTVNIVPASITGTVTICLGSGTNLYNTVAGGSWISANTAVATVGSSDGIVSGISAGTATVSYILPTGCYTTTVITVKPPSAPPTVADVNYCEKAKSVPAMTATGTALLWYDAVTGGTPLSSAPVPSTDVPGVETWYVTQNTNGCESDRVPVHAYIHVLPHFQITLQNESLCMGDTATFTVSGLTLPGASYYWTIPTYSEIVKGTHGDSIISIRFDTTTHHNYVILTVNDGYEQCSVSDTMDVHVDGALPQAHFYIAPDVCRGDSVTVALTEHAPGVTDYIWNFDGGNVVIANSNHGGPYKVVWNTTGRHIVTVRSITTMSCPPHDAADTFMVHEPDARMAPVVGDICSSDSLIFAPLVYSDRNKYDWEPAHFFNQNNAGTIYGRVERTGYIKLTVTDEFGCKATSSLYMDPDPCCKVFLPNAFTPGALTNNRFHPVTEGNHEIHIFRVQNRWGQTVFQSASEGTTGWDGKLNGVPQDADTYFYYLKYDCNGKSIEMKGDVTLIR